MFYVASADGDIEKELKDLAHSVDDAATVPNFMLTVAEADGEIEPTEMVVLATPPRS